MHKLALSADEIVALKSHIKYSPIGLIRCKAQVVLMCSLGASQSLISESVVKDVRSVQRYVKEFEIGRLSSLFSGHIDNENASKLTRIQKRRIRRTLLRKPEEVDAVNQRDIYHINAVDEVTQWEVVFCVPQITEDYMLVALKEIFSQFPFKIFNFHSDRGHENINYQIANFLQKLLIKQTKSRSYHSSDNALVETKNGFVIRKNMDWEYINRSLVENINNYYKNYFNPYLNYHRPCGYPTITTDLKGRKTKTYETYTVPYEMLKQIPNADKYLKQNITFKDLDKLAYKNSDNDFAKELRQQENKLFDMIQTVNKSGVSL